MLLHDLSTQETGLFGFNTDDGENAVEQSISFVDPDDKRDRLRLPDELDEMPLEVNCAGCFAGLAPAAIAFEMTIARTTSPPYTKIRSMEVRLKLIRYYYYTKIVLAYLAWPEKLTVGVNEVNTLL